MEVPLNEDDCRMEVPLDEDDCRFARTFAVEEAGSAAARAFFAERGFIAFRDVVEPAACARARRDMWSLLEEQHAGFRRGDATTWDAWPTKGFGMPGKHPVFRAPILALREHPRVHACFAGVLGERDLICSHDRWVLYRRTLGVAGGERADWRTKRNVHLDLNPREFLADDAGVYARLAALRYADARDFVAENNDAAAGMGLGVQGLVNLRDNEEADGGTLVVPGSHRELGALLAASAAAGEAQASRVVGPMQFRVAEYSALARRARRVPLREGTVLIWDNRLAHGSAPNHSTRCRFMVPVKMFPRRLLSHDRAEARARAVARALAAEAEGYAPSELGRRVFGLDDAKPAAATDAKPAATAAGDDADDAADVLPSSAALSARQMNDEGRRLLTTEAAPPAPPALSARQMGAELLAWGRARVSASTKKWRGGGQLTEVAPRLFVGNWQAAADADVISKHSIQSIISCAGKPGCIPGVIYHRMTCRDEMEDESLAAILVPCAETIDSCVRSGESVLVHCRAGHHRSPAVIVAYLVRYRALSLAEALDHVALLRPAARPERRFRGCLEAFARQGTLPSAAGSDRPRSAAGSECAGRGSDGGPAPTVGSGTETRHPSPVKPCARAPVITV